MPNRSPIDPGLLSGFIGLYADWKVENNRMVRKFQFKSFAEAWEWMSKVAYHAENLNHHPVWKNNYTIVEVELWTHDSGCITELDYQLAVEMEAVLPPDFYKK